MDTKNTDVIDYAIKSIRRMLEMEENHLKFLQDSLNDFKNDDYSREMTKDFIAIAEKNITILKKRLEEYIQYQSK